MRYNSRRNHWQKVLGDLFMSTLPIVYIFRNGETNQYKIGVTQNLNERARAIQTGCPADIFLIKAFICKDRQQALQYEKILHKYFKKQTCRATEGGEWFNLTKWDIAKLCEPQTDTEVKNLLEKMQKTIDNE